MNTLLDFSRIEAGRVTAAFVPTDLAAFTAELASGFRSAAQKAGLWLQIDCPSLPEPVYLDLEMWEKVVLNLVSNAYKYTLRGGIRVSVAAQDGQAVLRVQDTGHGIPEHELPRLFERFHRVEGVQGRTHEGTGIGLALVQELVKLHGGTIAVQSRLGAGTTFEVRLPFGHRHLPAGQVQAPPAEQAPRPGAHYVAEALGWVPTEAAPLLAEDELPTATGETRAQIVLADDNPDMREYVARLLRSQGHVVRAVGDGQAVLDELRRAPADLVLTDVMMPGWTASACCANCVPTRRWRPRR